MEPPDPGSYPCTRMVVPPPARRPIAALLTTALLASCGAAPEPIGHVHRFTTMVTVTDQALLPAASVSIPAFSTVVFRNRSAHTMSIEIESAACPSCDTVLGFAAGANGARSTDIAPGAVATLCFHAPGTFPFLAHVGGTEHRGKIEVGGAP